MKDGRTLARTWCAILSDLEARIGCGPRARGLAMGRYEKATNQRGGHAGTLAEVLTSVQRCNGCPVADGRAAAVMRSDAVYLLAAGRVRKRSCTPATAQPWPDAWCSVRRLKLVVALAI